MSEHWGGAQWLLAAYLALCLTAPVLVRVAGFSIKPPGQWLGWYAGPMLDVMALTAILAWGGFWK